MKSVIDRVDAALQLVDSVTDETHFPGRLQVRNRLLAMRAELLTNSLPPRAMRTPILARLVTDSWPLSSELSEAVSAAERSYREF